MIMALTPQSRGPSRKEPTDQCVLDEAPQLSAGLVGAGRAGWEGGLADPDALGTARTVVAGLGLLRPRDAAALVAATTRVADIDALVPDARAFRLPAEIVGAHEEACRLLTTSGWNMVTFGPDNSVPQAWSRLVAQREAR